MEKWSYREMGSRDKITNALRYYRVDVIDFVIVDCECEARQFRRFSPCKHMKRLQEKTGHLKLK